MNIDDEILIKSFGQGLKIKGHEDIVTVFTNIGCERLLMLKHSP